MCVTRQLYVWQDASITIVGITCKQKMTEEIWKSLFDEIDETTPPIPAQTPAAPASMEGSCNLIVSLVITWFCSGKWSRSQEEEKGQGGSSGPKADPLYATPSSTFPAPYKPTRWRKVGSGAQHSIWSSHLLAKKLWCSLCSRQCLIMALLNEFGEVWWETRWWKYHCTAQESHQSTFLVALV